MPSFFLKKKQPNNKISLPRIPFILSNLFLQRTCLFIHAFLIYIKKNTTLINYLFIFTNKNFKLFSILIRKSRRQQSGVWAEFFKICRSGWERVFCVGVAEKRAGNTKQHLYVSVLFLSLIIYLLLFLANLPTSANHNCASAPLMTTDQTHVSHFVSSSFTHTIP